MKTILVAGGAGYIGSHMVALLVERGYDVVVADNLRTGHWQAVKGARKLYIGDLRDGAFLNQIFEENQVDGVINFAAYSLVGGTICLLESMVAHGVDKIVFSSTAATYGEPEKQPIEETDRTEPTNPYGATKLAIEGMLKWCDKAYGIHYVALRYFNAAGSNQDVGIGEDHSPESHLIPLVLKTALGQRDHIGIYGDDYPTADGTCIRDYIHTSDLASAHRLALEYLLRGGRSEIFNLGSEHGLSVREIVEAAREVTGVDFPVKLAPRRAGDPAVLIASNRKAREVLGWVPRHSDAHTILASAWKWHRDHPNGFDDK